MNNSVRYILANGLTAGLSTAFLVHFLLIATKGRVYIQEPNPFILMAEIAGMIGAIWFAFDNLRRTPVRKPKASRHSPPESGQP